MTYRDGISVLIETYWNVNPSFLKVGGMMIFVLIETYWNVNNESM